MSESPSTPVESLYIHVPFCAHKCEYCAFYSEASHGETIQRYVAALVREIELVAPDLNLRTLFFGGGTPSLLSLKQWETILAALHRIEARFGRARSERWGMRTLDLDLLAMGALVLPDAATAAHWRDLAPMDQIAATPDRLILPHPRIQDRAFVLVPLADVAPRWRHPSLGLTVAQMLRRLPPADRRAVIAGRLTAAAGGGQDAG